MPSSTPRGVATSEFWLTVAGLALAAAHLVASALGVHFSSDAATAANLATALPIVYAALRTWLKTRVPTIGNDLPDLSGDSPAPSAPSIGATVPQPTLAESVPPADTPVQVVPIIGKETTTGTTPPPSPFIGVDAPAA